ncbi:MAG: lipopolysaccharide transport periplasmic protein LptA [Pseudomonadales bacterium]
MALPQDELQPINIKADSSERDEKKGVTTFTGSVTIDQGSLHIDADKVVIYGIDEISKIVATGKPAKLRQQPEADKQVVHAHGNTVEYLLGEERVHLIDNAFVEQEGSTVRGDRIDYDIVKQLVKANSKSANGRVQMIIPPKKKASSTTRDAQQ